MAVNLKITNKRCLRKKQKIHQEVTKVIRKYRGNPQEIRVKTESTAKNSKEIAVKLEKIEKAEEKKAEIPVKVEKTGSLFAVKRNFEETTDNLHFQQFPAGNLMNKNPSFLGVNTFFPQNYQNYPINYANYPINYQNYQNFTRTNSNYSRNMQPFAYNSHNPYNNLNNNGQFFVNRQSNQPQQQIMDPRYISQMNLYQFNHI